MQLVQSYLIMGESWDMSRLYIALQEHLIDWLEIGDLGSCQM